jgi:uncharacterized protein YndB with AHSA1/START domain
MNLTNITVTRVILASPEQIFDAWIDPTTPGGPWYGADRVILNLVVDGLFYHAVKHAGRTWPHYGRFLQIDHPRQLEFTSVSEATQGVETVVRVTLEPKGDTTEVTLRHSGVPDDEMGRQHEAGWNWALSVLAERLAEC